MSTNKKVLSIVVIMLLTVSLMSIFVFIYNFKNYSIKNTTEKAISIAQNVRDGLTSHMLNGTMDKRDIFLKNIAQNQNIDNFHLLRAPSVVNQYGAGLYGETISTKMEDLVLETSTIQTKLLESIDEVILKVSIPYIASSTSSPNCMACHTSSKEGDVLGVISMDIEVSSTRMEGILIALKILLIVLVLLIISIAVVNYFIRPYIKLFDDLENGISQAYRGDFTYQIDTTLTNEAGKVAQRLNELSEIYKFKKTIELDEDKKAIYNRIIHILKAKFDINKFMLFEMNNKTKRREIFYNSTNINNDTIDKDINICRAFRTSTNVYSSDFDEICTNCKQNYNKYICLYFNINETFSIVLHIEVDKQEENYILREYLPIINNYLEMAKPVIESKILMGILKDSSLTDPMTTLYNRRFLNELLDSKIPTRTNKEHIHAILMLDIDFFKQVNDTYGHDIGDNVIKSLALTMKKSVRDSDMPVRYGGEEFLILLLNTTKENALEISNTIKDNFASEVFSSKTETFKKTLSIGVAYYPDNANTLWKVIKYADEALYEAKNGGRNKIVVFEQSMHKDGLNY